MSGKENIEMYTTSCFIENNEQNREWLESLGYGKLENDTETQEDILVSRNTDSVGKPFYYTVPNHHERLWNKDNFLIDCTSNQKLFQAATALRNDSDIHQWFTDGKKWVISDIHDLLFIPEYLKQEGFDIENTHKATLEELTLHFNDPSHTNPER